MTFIWPWMLLSLLALPLLLVYARGNRRGRQRAALDGAGVFRSVTPPGKRRRVPLLFSLTGLTCLLFALARPEMPLSLPRAEGTVILAFDVSASMAADDLEPSRMDAAKTAAATFIDAQPATVRIGVLAFSDGGLLVQPPTDDRAELLLAHPRRRTNRPAPSTP
jgi:Ca-activated chloride channel family protein